jgi:hypothetical protein
MFANLMAGPMSEGFYKEESFGVTGLCTEAHREWNKELSFNPISILLFRFVEMRNKRAQALLSHV